MIIKYDKDNKVAYTDIVPGKYEKWARSEFPHPLVTLDFDEEDNLLGIELMGVVEVDFYDSYAHYPPPLRVEGDPPKRAKDSK